MTLFYITNEKISVLYIVLNYILRITKMFSWMVNESVSIICLFIKASASKAIGCKTL